MNPPLNCGAKIATKIESANFSVKKVHFSAKTARQGAFGAPERISFHDLTAPTGRRSALQTSPLPPPRVGAHHRLPCCPRRTPERASFHCPIGRRRTPQGTAGRRGWTSAGGQPADGQALGCSLSPDPAERHRAPPGTGAPRPHPATGAHRSAPQITPPHPPGAAAHHLPRPHRPCNAPDTLPPWRRFRGRRLHYRPSCLIFDFRKPQNSASRENTFPR